MTGDEESDPPSPRLRRGRRVTCDPPRRIRLRRTCDVLGRQNQLGNEGAPAFAEPAAWQAEGYRLRPVEVHRLEKTLGPGPKVS